MGQLRKMKNGAYGTHSVSINTKVGNEKGHKIMMDMHGNTVSKDSPIRNDVSSTTTIGSNTSVKRDVNNNSSPGSDIGVGIKGLFTRKGGGKKINL